jgi:hypothetical protein
MAYHSMLFYVRESLSSFFLLSLLTFITLVVKVGLGSEAVRLASQPEKWFSSVEELIESPTFRCAPLGSSSRSDNAEPPAQRASSSASTLIYSLFYFIDLIDTIILHSDIFCHYLIVDVCRAWESVVLYI